MVEGVCTLLCCQVEMAEDRAERCTHLRGQQRACSSVLHSGCAEIPRKLDQVFVALSFHSLWISGGGSGL